ncbi:hypothetical protein ACFSVM_00660 [Paenibacillus shunpengii]|uniref:Uncharacterized protein n=1 Tax=Paenibacillus shunpengii TaxID=2054424 RepID=A0ABW5SGP4_9BACL|nr:hypothetical protein [Paenibacillus sp. FSL H7-0326]OMC72304.1 hypothetical protein BK126_10030 [Paenibacillus sp. FSL H7-0326]
MDLAEGLSDYDRPRLFHAFLNGYTETRQLRIQEQELANDIYAVAASMWFTTIRYEEEALDLLVERSDTKKIERVLDEMLEILSNIECIYI